MKKQLLFIGALSFASITTAPVIACGSEKLDSILNAIKNGDTNYSLWDLDSSTFPEPIFPNDPNKVQVPATYTLDKKQEDTIAKTVVKQILDKATITTPVLWSNSGSLPEGTQCYNYGIANGTASADNKTTWDVTSNNARFTINIVYQVGTVDKDHNFNSTQQITASFNIKCAWTASDVISNNVFNAINAKKWDTNPLMVDLGKVKMPGVNVSYNDFSNDVRAKMNEAVIAELSAIPEIQTVTIVIKSTNTLTNDNKITVTFDVVYNDAKFTTNPAILQLNSITTKGS